MQTSTPLTSDSLQPDQPALAEAAAFGEARRKEFPVFANHPGLAYLDSAATAQKPQVVIDALVRFYETTNANIHRGVYDLSQRASAGYEDSRETVRRFLGAPSVDEVVFVRGTTEALNLIAHSFLAPRLQPGDRILLTDLEHHSNIVPWQLVADAAGAVIDYVVLNDAGELRLDVAAKLLARKPKIFSVAHVSNVLGSINPIRQLAAMAQMHGVPMVVDGAQAVGHIGVDVQQLGCDFYVFSGHKAYAPMGIGALWGRKELLAEMKPFNGGGGMIDEVLPQRSSFAPVPARFEAGTPAVADACGLGAALEYLTAIGIEEIEEQGKLLGAYARRSLTQMDRVRVYGTSDNFAPIVAFTVDGVHPHDVATILDSHGIAVRAGHHCTQILHRKLGANSTVRASFGVYNTPADVNRLVEGLLAAQKLFTRRKLGNS